MTASATIRNPQTFNRYAYVLNSPYKFTDPQGRGPAEAGTQNLNSEFRIHPSTFKRHPPYRSGFRL